MAMAEAPIATGRDDSRAGALSESAGGSAAAGATSSDSSSIAAEADPIRDAAAVADVSGTGGDNVTPFPAAAAAPRAEPSSDGAPAEAASETATPLTRLEHKLFAREPARECLSAEQAQEFRKAAQARAVDPEVNEELSLALGLAQRIRTHNCRIDSAYERIRFIFECLTAEPVRLVLARDERLRLQVEIYRQAGVISRTLARLSAGSPAGLVLAAVAVSTVLWAAVVFGVHTLAHSGLDSVFKEIFFMNGKALAVITSAAFIGGVVSIATRLREFSQKRDLDPFAMFWTAMLKPLIGVVLSLFLLATLAGGIISFGFLGEDPFLLGAGIAADAHAALAPKVLYTLWALGFLSGFSERFAWDFVDRAQGAASGTAGASAQKPA
jgi:hypothetical protein